MSFGTSSARHDIERPWCPVCLTDLIHGPLDLWSCPRCRARRFTEELRWGVALDLPSAIAYDAEHTL